MRLALSLILLTLGTALANDEAETPLSSLRIDTETTLFSANSLTGRQPKYLHGKGNVRLKQGRLLLRAKEMHYWPLSDLLEARGDVRLEDPRQTISGRAMRFHPDARSGELESPSYFLRDQSSHRDESSLSGRSRAQDEFLLPPPSRPPSSAHGEAERIELHDGSQSTLKNATYTTCRPGDEAWYAKAETLTIDHELRKGSGTHAYVYFKGVPILYTPLLVFPLHNERVSGFLPPTWGTSTRSGLELYLPYYWNIAPNYDLLSTARFMGKLGTQLNNKARYLGRNYSGHIEYDVLDDKAYGQSRQRYAIKHRHNFGRGFTGRIDFSDVSDHQYFADLSSTLASSSQTHIPRRYTLNYNPNSWWSADAVIQRYRTLRPDPEVAISKPYFLEPQVNFRAKHFDVFGFQLNAKAQYSNFTHPSRIQGQRVVLYPQLLWPLVTTPGFYLNPKFGVHMSQYTLNQRNKQILSVPKLQRRTVPVFSVDSGLAFDRQISFLGKDYAHTLEPRLFYVNIPYQNQSNIPVFDTGATDFSFAQIFTENRYAGDDRVGDADQLTAGLTTRLIDKVSGFERFRGTLAQRFYLRTPRAGLPNETLTQHDASDVLAFVSSSILPRVYVDAAVQYDQNQQLTSRSSFGIRYQPSYGKALSFSHRMQHNQLEHIDITAQWPIYGGWYGVGRYNYALKDKSLRDHNGRSIKGGRFIEGLIGIEYRENCWVARAVAHRIESVGGKPSVNYFAQLELNNFAMIGFNPLDLLSRSVPGYTKINHIPPELDEASQPNKDVSENPSSSTNPTAGDHSR